MLPARPTASAAILTVGGTIIAASLFTAGHVGQMRIAAVMCAGEAAAIEGTALWMGGAQSTFPLHCGSRRFLILALRGSYEQQNRERGGGGCLPAWHCLTAPCGLSLPDCARCAPRGKRRWGAAAQERPAVRQNVPAKMLTIKATIATSNFQSIFTVTASLFGADSKDTKVMP